MGWVWPSPPACTRNARNRLSPCFGDGAVGAAGMDIETAARWNIPAVFLHENNNTLICGFYEHFYAKVANPTGNLVQDSWQTVHDIRYDKMFAEVGCHTEFIERPEQAKEAIARAMEVSLREKKPSFVECFVDMDALSTLFTSNPLFRSGSVNERLHGNNCPIKAENGCRNGDPA